jgi:LmbE family N-acetylglucosaminyl deacetylase
MHALRLGATDGPLRILCLGAHCDDLEIGCGGSMLRLLEENPSAEVMWVVFTSNPVRKAEAEAGARRILQGAGRSEIRILEFRDGFLPYSGLAVKEAFEEIKGLCKPDLIFTHQRHDLHQDHRLICELTWNTWRNHMVLEYEIAKYDGDMGAPNFFIPLAEETCRRKVEAIRASYASQHGKQWFTDDIFWSLMRLRGMEANSPSRHAEAFYSRKAVL